MSDLQERLQCHESLTRIETRHLLHGPYSTYLGVQQYGS
jgi:hypothetical protein